MPSSSLLCTRATASGVQLLPTGITSCAAERPKQGPAGVAGRGEAARGAPDALRQGLGLVGDGCPRVHRVVVPGAESG